MKIGIIGVGYVGLITGVCLSYIGHKVICYDVNKEKIEKLNNSQPPIFEEGLFEMMEKVKDKIIYTADKKIFFHDINVIFLAVGTPEDINGSPNLSYIYQACDDISKNINNDCVVVIKSTVPVGTSEQIEKYFKKNSKYRVDVVSNPEFLSQGSAIHDTLFADRIIIGCDKIDDRKILRKIYTPLLNPPYNVPLVETDRNSAEMIKYASNNFLALKLSYINEIANLCKKNNANIEAVVKGMGYDNRIGNKFFRAGIGYGGSCLPKDTKALYWYAKKKKVKLETIKACLKVNERQKIILFNELIKDLKDLKDKTIAILGVTFKPGTDDLRDAPSIDNIIKLFEAGAKVNVYDPIGIENLKKILSHKSIRGEISYFKNIDETIKHTDSVMIMTEWPEIINYKIENFRKLMNEPRIYDGRNCYSLKQMVKHTINYTSIGRPTINNLEKNDFEMLKSEILKLFNKKLSFYMPFDYNDKRKYLHTLEVAKFANMIAVNNDLDTKSLMALYIICIFHDLGRFFENQHFNKLNDHNEIDHANQSVISLFDDDEIIEILKRYKLEKYKKTIIEAISFHNKLIFPNDNVFLKILMDADKLSILHLVGKGKIISLDITISFSKKCLMSFKKHQLIDVKDISSNSDSLLKYLAFIFNFNFKESLLILKNEGYIKQILTNIKYNLDNSDLNYVKTSIYDYLSNIDLKEEKNEVFSIDW